MANNKSGDIADGILGAIAIIGATWLGIEILKSLSKKETVYSCPVCNFSIKYGTQRCPNCNSLLTWPETQLADGK